MPLLIVGENPLLIRFLIKTILGYVIDINWIESSDDASSEIIISYNSPELSSAEYKGGKMSSKSFLPL